MEPHDTDVIDAKTDKTYESVRADQLRIGDILLNDDESFDSIVEAVYTDPDGTWLDTGDTMGYVNPEQTFRVERFNVL